MTPYDDRWDMTGQGPAEETPAPSTSPDAAKPAAPSHSKKKRSAKDVFLDLLGGIIPKAGDSAMEIVRKCVFMVALLVLIGSVSYLLNDMVIQPAIYKTR